MNKASLENSHLIKTDLRKKCLQSRSNIKPRERIQFSLTIEKILLDTLKTYDPDKLSVLCYRSTAYEVSTDSLFLPENLLQTKMYAPKVDQHHMHWLRILPDSLWHHGSFNISEPDQGELWQAETGTTILICPLVGFDRTGNRLGMGKGFFDRWLERHRQDIDILIGLAFTCQEVPHIPAEAHDIPLDAIITEKGWISCHRP
ncbi:MAG: 5-formyltetrahydrofolate cyclo-ligase [Zetaproteobacteria bacterium CG_4_9_14_3_um_filter_49_83]|nr:MAG: 5-formyltetrahydrofolate cyclo-ligase [Zetaproteobacteria bacterium CG1_02_49_23]PIQ31763.1 MAG: 5-formyltetrahydrofolate cyclo-ligase [Zetaproteobacteria bacterium CG17_big_fil_post_rev_8_21_14_2_50_50_13]PIV30545.1 MAG: 5-formyltetrahydrofolate cyclo-ligase [Zetaproteobacteria bacterium CG02_land_8_20_14_3_00_50_9]PIY56634.1 MAG: 5-formyltetrahydrofolate cyclo-ligase [Zetaproteobacteria bacterium CG_4_10_14_0_8_um_filter_49_80]PJA34189.1 MAG: 5-formyltetrahydrofolate cyclo-ligase [Zet